MAADNPTFGFIGLGNMGGPMARNVTAGGYPLIAFDAAGTEDRAPDGARHANGLAGIAANADVVLLSLPDGAVVQTVARQIVSVEAHATRTIVDHSTIGPTAAAEIAAELAAAGITYIDAPVSGGTKGAASAGLAMMIAGPKAICETLDPVFATMAKNRFYVGDRAGQGQVMKCINNFLSATAMVATSEAVAFGVGEGLDPTLMVDVINASSGQNTATSDKFPNRIINEKFDAGFTIDLLTKDVRLYLEQISAAGAQHIVGDAVGGVLGDMKDAMPGEDFTRLYSFIKGRGGVDSGG